MHSASLSFIKTSYAILLLSCCFALLAQAAITTPISRDGDYVEENASGTLCYYPQALNPRTIDVACVGPEKGDFAQVIRAHLNETTSINYFSASLELLGGTEFIVEGQGDRKIYLCLSGRAGDYTYQTMCTTVGRDNSLGTGGPSPFCKVEGGQRRVTDGCYIPNQPAPDALLTTSSARPAIVTITRTSGSSVRTTLTQDRPSVNTQNASGAASGGTSGTTRNDQGLLLLNGLILGSLVVMIGL
ncbi:hypothetical protein FA15DRAFT_675972 [Coprinopsis marcescibilis]|uniref:Uncharacterized protein n=1 Tax=Coprinopsis marcescibilis TaxID=230819 RepID=A0A5C3KD97_COPMA|nr:hypothetical protein FA15DRAFT_675972 [Coprinopsis marcescibilis]